MTNKEIYKQELIKYTKTNIINGEHDQLRIYTSQQVAYYIY
ncbi:hypothetical protein RIU75_12665 [Companilactobacillus alimentarius]|nr:hypothetical protein [Companilactobacillus alimentarius]